MQNQTNWASLRKAALNRAQHPVTRKLILLAWTWKNTHPVVIADLAENNVYLPTLQNYVNLITKALPANL